MSNNLIVKSNQLIEARYNLNLNEQKLFLYAVSRLHRDLKEFEPITVNIKDFIDLIEIQGSQYEYVRDIARSLRSKEVFMKIDSKEVAMGWFSKVKAEPYSGDIEIFFDNDLVPYLLQLKNRFTSYHLRNILYLKNKYSIRVYELLKEFQGLGKREFELEELRDMLMVGDKYRQYKEFSKFVLKVTAQEINEHTDINVDYEKVTRGRKVVGVKYLIQPKQINEYKEFLEQNYDIKDLKERMGLSDEVFSTEQVMELYTIATQKVQDEVDPFLYIRLNYKYMISKGTARSNFAYLKETLSNDYAKAFAQLKFGYIVEE